MRSWGLSMLLLASVACGLAATVGCTQRARTGVPTTLTSSSKPETATPGTTQAAVATLSAPSTTSAPATPVAANATPASMTFAVIGDYGVDDSNELAVARLVAARKASFVVTTGDNYYAEAGGSGTAKYDRTVGAYFGGWIKDLTTTGSRCPQGSAAVNSFFPAMGNHDYTDAEPASKTYLTYFNLPGAGFANTSGNERYYEFVQGPVHFFVLNSNPQEEAGTSPDSMQGRWLRQQLAASTSQWNVVVFHHPPYSSDSYHGPTPHMQWPFAAWGADAVISGHVHTYERINRDGVVYFVNGIGGEHPFYNFAAPVAGSQVRYNAQTGAQIVSVSDAGLQFEFVTAGGAVIDRYVVPAPPAK